MAQQQRQFQMGGQYNVDTTYTKIFVGGLAWETQRDTMRRYFEQFGEIQEAVVITDKLTGRSKGYGFVTFKDPDAAMRACQNPSPVIDGRRANCNLASLGAQKTYPTNPQHGTGRYRTSATTGIGAPPSAAAAAAGGYQHGSSSTTFFNQPTTQYSFPYSTYGYTGYSQDTMYPMNYYGYSPYYTTTGASSQSGYYQNVYPPPPYYAQYPQSSQTHDYRVQYPQMLQYPYLPQQYSNSSAGILSFPSSMPLATTTTDSSVAVNRMENAATVTITARASASEATRAVSEENSSA